MRLPGFVGPTYSARSITMAGDRCINLYPELIESGTGKSRAALIGTPGLRTFAQGKVAPVRGMFENNYYMLVAIGDILYNFNNEGALTSLGQIADGPGAVTFAGNGPQYFVVSNGHGYLVENNVMEEITPEGFSNFAIVVFLDTYFVALEGDSRRLWISGSNDGRTWNPLDFRLKETAPDNVQGILADHGEIWVFGMKFSEVWYNSGNADFPLERVPNARLEFGLGAIWSPAKMDNSIFWLGNDERGNRVVWRASGYNGQRVSTHGVEHHLNRFGDVSGAVGWTYQEEGHSFYCLQFPDAPPNTELTWVYDAATGLWHERGWWDKIHGRFEPHRARCHMFAYDRHFVGDRNNGKIYRQALDIYDDDGDRIRRIRVAPHFCDEMKRINFDEFQLDMEPAVGLGAVPTREYGPDMFGQEYEQ